jgi:hypothetical protein
MTPAGFCAVCARAFVYGRKPECPRLTLATPNSRRVAGHPQVNFKFKLSQGGGGSQHPTFGPSAVRRA